jgi:hypothetical protein
MKTRFKTKNGLWIIGIIIISFIASCGKDNSTNNNNPSLATVTTDAPIKVNDTTYTLGGNVTNQGASAVTENGVAIALTANPVINDPDGATIPIANGTGSFSTDVAPFAAGYTYYVRAYAKNSNGVAYGNEVTINTGSVTTACDTVMISKNITTPTTWMAGKVYVITTSIYVNAQLTIQPGVVIKFKGSGVELRTWDSNIIANGTAANPIIFTSFKDDNYCGDSNGDGSTTVPAKGDWGKIVLSSDVSSSFKYCQFLYAGGAGGGRAIDAGGGNHAHPFSFDHCTIAHTASAGGAIDRAQAFTTGYYSSNAVQTLTNNAFYDNDVPLNVGNFFTVDPSNIFHNPSNPSQKNTRNCIFLYGSVNGDITVTYNVTEVPYVTEGLEVDAPDHLIFGPNVIMKMYKTSSGYSYNNNPNEMTFSSTVVFTSIYDDTRGGDTNGDGNATLPNTGDWYGIHEQDASSLWRHTNVFYNKY